MECVKGWDPALVTIAQNYANDCTINHHTPVTSPVASSCGGLIGEALFYSATKETAPNSIFGIMAEGDFNYDLAANTCNPDPTNGQSQVCDNYKQVYRVIHWEYGKVPFFFFSLKSGLMPLGKFYALVLGGSLREPSQPSRQTGFRQIWLLAADQTGWLD